MANCEKKASFIIKWGFFYVIIIRQDFTNLDAILKRWEVVSMMNWDLTVLTVIIILFLSFSSRIFVLLSCLLPTNSILLVGFLKFFLFYFSNFYLNRFKQILRIRKELSKILLRKTFFIKIYSNPFKIQLIEII